MTRLTVSALCLLTVCLWASPAPAQDPRCRRATIRRRISPWSKAPRSLERDGRTETRPGVDAAAGRRSAAHRRTGASKCCSPTAARCTSTPTRVVDFQSDEVVRLLEGRVRLSIAGPVARPVLPHRCARRPGSRSARRANTGSASCAERAKSSSRSCAAAPSWSTSRAAATSRPASGPSPAPAPRRRPPTSSTPPRGTRSIAGRRRAAISGSACPRNTCRTTCGDMRRRSTTTATGGTSRSTATSGTRASASDGVRITAAAGSASALRLDVDCRRPLGLADASLRPLGHLRRVVVLDSRAPLGAGLGVLGLRARLCQLVSARVEQPADLLARM